jgi:transposase-like protein
MEVVREVEAEGKSFEEVRRKYGIGGNDTVQKWVRRYGNGSRGKIIRVERPEEINELKQLRERTRRLEKALADANLDLALERQYTRLACQRAGIENVEEFKKKAAGQRPMEP